MVGKHIHRGTSVLGSLASHSSVLVTKIGRNLRSSNAILDISPLISSVVSDQATALGRKTGTVRSNGSEISNVGTRLANKESFYPCQRLFFRYCSEQD